jgi:hypothetical protein
VTYTPSSFSSRIFASAFIGIAQGTSGWSISNSFSTGSVTALAGTGIETQVYATTFIGRIAASLTSGVATYSISNSYATGNISSASSITVAGPTYGFIGVITGYDVTVSGCFSTGTISFTGSAPTLWIGGLIASVNSDHTIVTNSYAMTTISVTGSGAQRVGGFIGQLSVGPTIPNSVSKSYSASPSMTGSGGNFHGFLGVPNAPADITNSYLYANGSVPSEPDAGVTSLNISQMQAQGSFTGFTFGTGITPPNQEWKMPSANPLSPNGLLSPVLYWQCGANGIVCP